MPSLRTSAVSILKRKTSVLVFNALSYVLCLDNSAFPGNWPLPGWNDRKLCSTPSSLIWCHVIKFGLFNICLPPNYWYFGILSWLINFSWPCSVGNEVISFQYLTAVPLPCYFAYVLCIYVQFFWAVYVCVEKVDLSKGYQDLKRKLRVTPHFSEIIELKFGKKIPYILCIFL